MSLESYLTEVRHWTLAELTSLLSEADASGLTPVMELYHRGLEKKDILEIISLSYNVPIIDLNSFIFNGKMTQQFGVQTCLTNHILFGSVEQKPIAVIIDPANEDMMEQLVNFGITNIGICDRDELLDYESQYLKPLQVAELSATVHVSDISLAEQINLANMSDDNAIQNIVSHLVSMAFDAEASDIQIIPTTEKANVFFRIDGKRKHILDIDCSALLPLHRVLGTMAKQQTDDIRKLVQGKIDFTLRGGRELEVRLNIIPTRLGSSFNLRLHLNKGIKLQEIADNAILQSTLSAVANLSDGLVLFCGPTGSGKSTSMAALARELLKRDINICAVEDPVEQVIPGINQVDVNTAKGLSFASVTRSFLRHDPDAIIIGEIRDPEVADIVIQAADTGHLVLSTLHTKNAVSAIGRLINLKVDRAALAENLAAIISQRLVRKVCPRCRRIVKYPTDHPKLSLHSWSTPEIECAEAVGCPVCNNTGYTGRIAICEALVVTEELRYAIESGKDTEELTSMLRKNNYSTFLDDGYRQLAAKATTLSELDPFITSEQLYRGASYDKR